MSGIKSKKIGAQFELEVRADLEKSGWIVSKWNNNVEEIEGINMPFEKAKLVHAKPKYNPFTKKIQYVGVGFPDFIAFKYCPIDSYDIMGIECKVQGRLSPEERAKCEWMNKNNIFKKIFIASKGKEREIQYKLWNREK